MRTPGSQRVVLDLDGGEPFRGHIQDGTGTTHPFRGWLEFSGMLEEIRRRAVTEPTCEGEPPPVP
jgi:hypothetical protein